MQGRSATGPTRDERLVRALRRFATRLVLPHLLLRLLLALLDVAGLQLHLLQQLLAHGPVGGDAGVLGHLTSLR